MSLLEDNDYSSDDDPFASLKDSSGRGSGKGKKGDKKGRGGEDKKAAHWTKNKANVVQEKTPKKAKGQGKSSTSWTPPDSPKYPTTLPADGKGVGLRGQVPVVGAGGAGSQLQPSPNIKNQRKRYSQLADSSDDEDEETGVLLSNTTVLQDHLGEGGAELPGNSISLQQTTTNPFLSDSTQFFTTSNFSSTANTTNVTSSLTGVDVWASLTQQTQPEQPLQQWMPMMPSAPMTVGTGPTGGGVGSVNPLLFTPAFDHGNQQQPPVTFDPNSMLASDVAFENVQSQKMATAPQPGPWGFNEDPFRGVDPTQLSQLLQPLTPQHQQPVDAAIGEMDTNPFHQPSWHAPHPPEIRPSTGLPTAEWPVQSSEVAPPPIAAASPPSSEDWSVSEELCIKCVQQFATLQPVNGVLEGSKARQFFGQSKLPFQELSAIWRLSDRDQDNALSQDEFCIAMKLVLMRRKGVAIPATLPEPLCSINSAAHLVPIKSTSPKTSVQEGSRGVSPVLVDVQDVRATEPPDALLVNLDDAPLGNREQVSSPQPPVARIISLDEESSEHHSGGNEEEEEGGEDSVLVKLDKHEEPGVKAPRPTKPAPMKPGRPPKFKRPPPPAFSKKKTAPSSAINKVSSPGELSPSSPTHSSPPQSSSPPHTLTSSSVPDMMPHIIDSTSSRTHPPPKPPRPLNVPSKKSSYMALLSSPVEQGHPDNLEYPPAEGNGSRDRPSGPTSGDDESEGTFQFKPLSDAGMASSSADESTDKGHSRSTSLDLNKMFMGSAKPGDVFGGLPSAVPPKPPPKLRRVSSPPADSLVQVLEGVESSGAAAQGTPTLGQPRPRSLSTGSMASMGGGSGVGPADEHIVMDTSTDALLLHHNTPPPRPKPRKVPILPPKPTSFPTSSNHSATSGSTTSSSSNSSATTTAKHTVKPARSDMNTASALRRTGPQNRANLAELYQQNDVEGEESTGLNTRLTSADSVKSTGSREQEGLRSKPSSSSVVLKDKVELKASIRSLKENNEALQDINRNLEQKLFQLMDERVRLARELDLLNALS